MPYQIQPYNYQSTFVPTDLGVIQRGLEQRQGRYDSANQAWAQTKMALYDDPSYDPSVKEEVVKKVEGNFDNLYKSYNGDMGAAVSDLTQMIGGIRKDPYFSLNKVALEKQKEYEALKKAYGAKGIEFKGMPKGLRDPNTGKLRSQEEFAPDVLMDSGMDEKLASIVKQSMVDASTQGGLTNVPGRAGLLQSVTKYGPGHGQAGKAESIYKEYLQTPEGQLRLRMLTEGAKFGGKQYDKVENPEEALKAIVNQAIANRVAESTKIDRMADPSYVNSTKASKSGSGELGAFITPSTSTETNVLNPDNFFPSIDDIKTTARENDVSNVKGAKARQIVDKEVSDIEFVKLREKMRDVLKRYGVNKEFYHNGIVERPHRGGIAAPGGVEKERAYNKEFDALKTQYDALLDKKLEKYKTGDHEDKQWSNWDAATVYSNVLNSTNDPDAAKKAADHVTEINTNLNKSFDGTTFLDFEVTGGPNKLTTEKALELKKKFEKSAPGSTEYQEYEAYNKAVTNPKKVQWTVAGEEVVYRVTNDNNITFNVKPTNPTLAMKLARGTTDPKIMNKTASEFYRFVGNKVFVKKNGESKPEPMPYGLSVDLPSKDKYGNNVYTLKNGKTILTVTQVASHLAQTHGIEYAENYLNQMAEHYQTTNPQDLPGVSIGEFALGTVLNVIK